MSKPDSDQIYAANDHHNRSNRWDEESREVDSLNAHHTGDPDGVHVPHDRSDVQWLRSIAPEYLVAGDAEFHVRKESTGKQHQFRVRLVSDENGVVWFVDYNVAPISRSPQWQYLGVFNPDGIRDGVLRVTRASAFTDGSLAARVFRHFAWIALCREDMPAGYKVRHGGRCACCGRLLKSERSAKHGIGPKCRVAAKVLFSNVVA